MGSITRQNHYVPEWYQKRFALTSPEKLFRLDLNPDRIVLKDGTTKLLNALSPRSPKSCFWSPDLYTTRLGAVDNDEIERLLFGTIDNNGALAVEALISGDQKGLHRHFQHLFEYLGAQTLRTPKGLDWIKSRYPELDQGRLMQEMQHLLRRNLAMLIEGVREVVAVAGEDAGFIVTDHPVTMFNVACEPNSAACTYPDDPALSLEGTQLVFPLSARECLIITHLDFANSSGSLDPLLPRQNARAFGTTLGRTDTIIRGRALSPAEVHAINFLLKKRARRYVAAAEQAWLYPERAFNGNWSDIKQMLLPKTDLWKFGGEVYVGYKDGTSSYQDPYGRTQQTAPYLQKVAPETVDLDEPCPCGGGRLFGACCNGLATNRRPRWDTPGIRERNLMMQNAIVKILGLRTKSWDEVRATLSNEQVSEIHRAYRGLWPIGTQLGALLPWPDSRVLRAVYMGLVDPRTTLISVASWTLYFDEIILVNPLPNPWSTKPEYNPIDSPEQFKAQTLKNVMLLLALTPLVDAGAILIVPDPGELDVRMGRTMMSMAEERCKNISFRTDDDARFLRLQREDFKRTHAQLPAPALKAWLRRGAPRVDDSMLDDMVAAIKDEARRDPLALLGPFPESGQLTILRGMSAELAMFLAQLTGAIIYTDSDSSWRQLVALSNGEASARQETRIRTIESQQFVHFHPSKVAEVRSAAEANNVRAILRDLSAKMSQESPEPSDAANDIARLSEALTQLENLAGPTPVKPSWAKLGVLPGRLALQEAPRLALLFGREAFQTHVPFALNLRPDER